MENIKAPIEDIIDDIKDYIDTSAEIYKLQATEKAAGIIANAIINMAIAFAAALFLLFASLAIAFMLSDFLDNPYIGFIIVAGIYAFIALLIYLTKDKWLKNSLVNNFIKSIYSK